MSLIWKKFKLNENQILEESLLKSAFTFGFELEAIADGDYYDGYSTSDDNGHYDEEEEDHYIESSEMSRAIDDNLTRLLNKNQTVWTSGTMQEDGSLSADNDEDFCFEWASPVFEYTPKNVKRTIDFLSGLSNIGIYTNSSCGFHHHISWKGINERDMIWTYVNLAMDEEFINKLTVLNTRTGKDINMSSDWAKRGPLNDIRDCIKERKWVRLLTYLTDDKYRILRIHPYGTIEWRGPRAFLNYRNLDYIKDFYKKFNLVISKVIECQNMKTILGTDITKDDFFKKLKEAQENEDAPNPDNDMRDNMEFLYRTGTYRGDRKIRLKRDKSDKTTYISEKYMKALNNNPRLLYNAILKCDDLVGFSKLIKLNDLRGPFKKLASLVDQQADKEFLDKLLKIMLYITDNDYIMKRYISNMADCLNKNDLLKLLEDNVKKGNDTKTFLRYIEKVSESGINITYKDFYNLLKHYAINGNNMIELSDSIGEIITFLSNSNYNKKQKFNIINLMVKIQFKHQSNYCPDSVTVTLNNLLTQKEKDMWDKNILGALFEKNINGFITYLLPTNDEDILKGIVAVIKLKGYSHYNLDGNILNKIRNWI